MENKFIVGITGGIASGKTTLTDVIRDKGAYIIDADVVSREVIAREDILEALRSAFPGAFIDGELSRALLKEQAFQSDCAREMLNGITHPVIRDEILRRIHDAPERLVFIVVPLLIEAGYAPLCNYIVTIVSDEQKRINRLVQRDTIDEELALAIMRSQKSESERISAANEVIVNNDTVETFKARASEFYKKMTGLEKSTRQAGESK